MDISPKVAAQTGAVGSTTPLNVILVWYLGKWNVPPEVSVSFATLLSMVVGGLVGWAIPHQNGAPPG